MPRTPDQIADLKKRVTAIEAWYHAVDLGDGIETPGAFRMADYLDAYHLPDLTGARVLDVGASNGYFSYEFERRGAAEVVAIDLPSWEAHDWTPRYRREYRARPEAEKANIDKQVLRSGFELLGEAFASKAVRKEERPIYDLNPEDLGTFDLVFCGSMLMHVRDPIRGIQAMRSVCKPEGRLVISISSTMADNPEPIARFAGEWDQCNWWQMNPACLKQVLVCSDFDRIEHEDNFVLEDTSGRFKDPTFVCHAFPRVDA